jgi:hypothetical protein
MFAAPSDASRPQFGPQPSADIARGFHYPARMAGALMYVASQLDHDRLDVKASISIHIKK